MQALEGLKQQLLTERESIVGGLEGTIGDLQGEIDSLTGAKDVAEAERDQALANNDIIKAEAADAQAKALEAQAGDYQAQLDELTGQSTQYQGQVSERDQTIADLQAQLAALQDAPKDPPPGLPDPGNQLGEVPGMGGKYDKPISIGGPGGKDGIVYAGGTPGFNEQGPGFTTGEPPISDFQVDLDKINALTPDDINPYIPFPELDIDIKPVVTPVDDGIAYKGGSKDFDFTGGLGLTKLPVKGAIKPPMPPSIGRLPPSSPVLGGSDYMPKSIIEPADPKPKTKPKPKPKPKKKPKNMIFAGARPKSRGTVRMGRGR